MSPSRTAVLLGTLTVAASVRPLAPGPVLERPTALLEAAHPAGGDALLEAMPSWRQPTRLEAMPGAAAHVAVLDCLANIHRTHTGRVMQLLVQRFLQHPVIALAQRAAALACRLYNQHVATKSELDVKSSVQDTKRVRRKDEEVMVPEQTRGPDSGQGTARRQQPAASMAFMQSARVACQHCPGRFDTKEQIQPAVQVLANRARSEERLEDATVILPNLSHGSILRLLLAGVGRLGTIDMFPFMPRASSSPTARSSTVRLLRRRTRACRPAGGSGGSMALPITGVCSVHCSVVCSVQCAVCSVVTKQVTYFNVFLV